MTDLNQKAREIVPEILHDVDTYYSYKPSEARELVLAGMRWAAEECARIANDWSHTYAKARHDEDIYAARVIDDLSRALRARFLSAAEEKPEAAASTDDAKRAALLEREALLLEREALLLKVRLWLNNRDVGLPGREWLLADFALAETADLRESAQKYVKLIHALRDKIERLSTERDEALQLGEGPSTLKDLAALAFERGCEVERLKAERAALVDCVNKREMLELKRARRVKP